MACPGRGRRGVINGYRPSILTNTAGHQGCQSCPKPGASSLALPESTPEPRLWGLRMLDYPHEWSSRQTRGACTRAPESHTIHAVGFTGLVRFLRALQACVPPGPRGASDRSCPDPLWPSLPASSGARCRPDGERVTSERVMPHRWTEVKGTFGGYSGISMTAHCLSPPPPGVTHTWPPAAAGCRTVLLVCSRLTSRSVSGGSVVVWS